MEKEDGVVIQIAAWVQQIGIACVILALLFIIISIVSVIIICPIRALLGKSIIPKSEEGIGSMLVAGCLHYIIICTLCYPHAFERQGAEIAGLLTIFGIAAIAFSIRAVNFD